MLFRSAVIDISETLTSSLGIPIPSGGTVNFDKAHFGDLPTRRWLGIVAVGSTNIRVWEVVN